MGFAGYSAASLFGFSAGSSLAWFASRARLTMVSWLDCRSFRFRFIQFRGFIGVLVIA